MKIGNSIGFSIAFVTCCYALLASPTGWAQEQVITDLEQRGRKALDAKQYSVAREIFSEGAASATDPDEKARLDFRQAVTLQQMATSGEVENPEETLMRAARLYHSYLRQNPDSTATANNLAKVYETLGHGASREPDDEKAGALFKRADSYYQKAIAAGGSSQAFYLKNYAEFLERSGDWRKAKTIYAQLIEEHPVSPKLQQALLKTYAEHGLGDVAEYLWNMLGAGYVRQSAGFALDALAESTNVRDKSRIELLTIACAALAQGTDDRGSYLDSDLGRRYAMLNDDSYLGNGAKEIYQLYQGQMLNPSDYDWWVDHGMGSSGPDQVLLPMDGFRALIRSLGSRSKRENDLEMAESYFKLAANIGPQEIDPAAIRDLVQMYAEQNEFDKIEAVLVDFQVRLFEGKGDAYREYHAEKIFQYHQTLGELYALIERWGDSSQIDSAVFQLERARQTSIVMQQRSPGVLPESYQFTPQMVDQLSTAYEKTGQAGKSVELRLDQAEIYNKAGDTKATRRVLAPVKASDLSSDVYKARYEKLIISPELRLPVNRSELQRQSIEGLEKTRR